MWVRKFKEDFLREVGIEVGFEGWEGFGEKGERRGFLDWSGGGESGNV